MKILSTLVMNNLRSHKMTQDIAWSLGSFFILAVSGIVINIVVTALRDTGALGIFNLAYAVYIVVSQFASWGIHYSVLRHAAYYNEAPTDRGRMFFTGATLAVLLGIISAGLMVWMQPLFVRFFDSPQTGTAIRYAAFGLILFPLNKVIMAYLNGLREMKAYSVLQGLRYLIVMIYVSVIAVSSLPITLATLGFIVAEFITVLVASIYLIKRKLVVAPCFCLTWMKRHFRFGNKALFGGIFTEVNSRLDVLLIGFFLDERTTGIYSFAAMLLNGLYHVLAMIRLNFNPLLVKAVRDNNWAQAQRMRIQSLRFVLPSILTLSLLAVVGYYALATWIMPGKGLMEGFSSLLILLAGLNTIAIFVPFDNLMLVSGHPGYHAVQQLVAIGANIAVAAALLWLVGIEGAALGTAASYIVNIVMLIIFAYRILGWRLISNTTLGTRTR